VRVRKWSDWIVLAILGLYVMQKKRYWGEWEISGNEMGFPNQREAKIWVSSEFVFNRREKIERKSGGWSTTQSNRQGKRNNNRLTTERTNICFCEKAIYWREGDWRQWFGTRNNENGFRCKTSERDQLPVLTVAKVGGRNIWLWNRTDYQVRGTTAREISSNDCDPFIDDWSAAEMPDWSKLLRFSQDMRNYKRALWNFERGDHLIWGSWKGSTLAKLRKRTVTHQ
jgi:hypothetical protein